MKEHRRIKREKKTLSAMIEIYCNQFNSHEPEKLEEYKQLLAYALGRVDNCPYGKDKPVCANCRIHCYKKEMRIKIEEVMRYSGPRMMFRHPYLSFMHFIDSLKKYPQIKAKKAELS